MEYAQITMDEYLGMKKDIHESIGKIVKNFVRIGKILYQIDQSEAYKIDGYKSLAEFARAEYDMTAGGVSRFVGVYKKYCDGESLKEGYEDYTYAQLVEMLNLPEEDELLIRPDTSREDIRNLKRFNKEGENDIHALESWKENEENEHEQYLKEMLAILFQKKDRESDFDAVCEAMKKGDMLPEVFSEYVNPGGNRTIRNGRTLTFLFENEIRMKIWGEDAPAVFSYGRLMEIFKEQFRDTLGESSGWWKKQFEPGNRDPEPENGSDEEKIAPAQKEGTQDPPQEEKEPEKAQKESEIPDQKLKIPDQKVVAPSQQDEENSCPPDVPGCRRQEWGLSEAQQKQGKKECGECWSHWKQLHPEKQPKQEEPDQEKEESGRKEEEQIPGQDTILNHPEYLPKDYQTDAQVDGEPVTAAVEPTPAQRKEECLSLISTIQGNVTMEKYKEAYQAAEQLLACLGVMKC